MRRRHITFAHAGTYLMDAGWPLPGQPERTIRMNSWCVSAVPAVLAAAIIAYSLFIAYA
ncbi:MAG: hypothetical protein ACREFW_01405 [Rhizomicrobium sp.]